MNKLIGLTHLVGTNMLRAYMHGYFMDIKLYHKVNEPSQLSWLFMYFISVYKCTIESCDGIIFTGQVSFRTICIRGISQKKDQGKNTTEICQQS